MTSALNTQQPLVHVISRRLQYTDFNAAAAAVAVIPMGGSIPKGALKTSTKAHLVTAFTPTSTIALTVGTAANPALFMTNTELLLLTAGNTLTGGTTGFGVLTADALLVAILSAPNSTTATAGDVTVAIEFIAPTMNKEASGLFDTNN